MPFQNEVWSVFFCLDLGMTQECIGACCVETSDKGKACGKFRSDCEFPLLIMVGSLESTFVSGVISMCSNFF